jgi:uncharacterized protein YaeQ
MALKSVIYKAQLQVADMDRHYYADHALNIACHPSETLQRMMTRILVFALHATESLELAKGISDVDEPDLWQKDLTGAIQLWIELGQPEERRILKACGRADQEVHFRHRFSRHHRETSGVRQSECRPFPLSGIPSFLPLIYLIF